MVILAALRWVSRPLLAALFIFSGVAKSLNTFGLSIQLREYFVAMELDFVAFAAPVVAIALPSLEILLGIMIALNLGRRYARSFALGSMIFFTLLTIWITVENPVIDCGCFGDVVKISHMDTLIKNLILLPFALIYFLDKNRGKRCSRLAWYMALPVSFALSLWSWFSLPLIEATPFRVGVHILAAMESGTGGEVETVLVYKNRQSGDLKEFSIDDTEWQNDTVWEFLDSRTIVVKEGKEPEIKSLPMIDSHGRDVSKEVLSSQERILLIVANELEKLPAIPSGYARVVVLTNGTIPEADTGGFELYQSDKSVINTIIQSYRGGALVLENGVIRNKMLLGNLR